MKIYFINLDRSPDRLDWFLEKAGPLGLDLQRVPAVDARDLGDDEIARQRSLSSGNSVLSPGEIACLQSHRKVWRIIVDGPDPWAFVAEDDIHFSADAAKFLGSPDWIPAGVELVKAETNLRMQEFSRRVWGRAFGAELRRIKRDDFGGGGYFLSREGAVRLLEFSEGRCEPVDVFTLTSRLGILDQTPVLQLVPAICMQDVYMDEAAQDGRLASVLASSRTDERRARKFSAGAKFRREAKRLAHQAAEPFRRLFLIATGSSVFRKVPFGGRESD